MPVRLIATAESKNALWERAYPAIIVEGTRGGSPVAAATLNALFSLALQKTQQAQTRYCLYESGERAWIISLQVATPLLLMEQKIFQVEEKNVACAQAIPRVLAPLPPPGPLFLPCAMSKHLLPSRITLPVGVNVTFAVHSCEYHADGSVTASVIKDAGDDPDVTHGAQLCSTLSWRATPGIQVDGVWALEE